MQVRGSSMFTAPCRTSGSEYVLLQSLRLTILMIWRGSGCGLM